MLPPPALLRAHSYASFPCWMRNWLICLLFASGIHAVQGGVWDFLRSGTNNPWKPNVALTNASVQSLSEDQVVLGLQEALGRGVQHAIAQLGRDGGFLTNLQVRIPMPQKLQTVEKTLRSLGQDRLADDFIATMNHAAEQAVPQAANVFIDAVQRMSIQDAKAILVGPEDSATQYFRRVTQTNLYVRFLPIVKTATDQAGVTSAYKRLMSEGSQNKYFSTLESLVLKNQPEDIDQYVTERALDGLFKMVAQEEAHIRKDPVARTSELLQKVFGAVTR